MSIPTSRAIGQADPSPRGASREVVDAIRDASKRSGVDFRFMLAKAQTESSFDPGAKARTSSASGLYQFIESTWLNTVRQHGAKHGLGQYAAQIEDDFGGGPKVRDAAARKTILDLRFDPRISWVLAVPRGSLQAIGRTRSASRPRSSRKPHPPIAACSTMEAGVRARSTRSIGFSNPK